ncbi:MAG: hypothetical protein KFF73_13105 [Cyclobacteriaceae bacterium]|nr:hypothetical protein [Cyclobacteriaceae bacterium]
MQGLLKALLSTFMHSYLLEDTSFMRTEQYMDLAAGSGAVGTDYIPWLSRDHGRIIWPPEGDD